MGSYVRERHARMLRPHVEGLCVRIVTPSLAGHVAEYTASMQVTLALAEELGVDLDTIYMAGQSCLPRARNQLCYDAIAQGAQIVGMIDADVGWSPVDLFHLLALMTKNDWPVLGGNYPKKTRRWADAAEWATERIRAGLPVTGDRLMRATQDCAYSMPGDVLPDPHGTCELTGLPAGFLFVQRRVLTTLAHLVPTYLEHDPPIRIPLWFDDRHVGPRVGGSLLSEDVSFCRLISAAGFPIRCFLPVELTHTGTEVWRGRAIDDYLDGMEAAKKEESHGEAKDTEPRRSDSVRPRPQGRRIPLPPVPQREGGKEG